MELWFVGQDHSLQDHYWYQGSGWQNFVLAAPGSASDDCGIGALSRIPTSMELWYVGADGSIRDDYWYQTPTVAEPPGGLNGNVNYFLDAGGSVLTGVTVAVRFTQDFVSTSNAFSFQLNCYSLEGPQITTEWQQYVIYASPGSTQLWARIDNWNTPPDELLRVDKALAAMPSTTIKAGYEFVFSLQTDSSSGNNVTGCVYSVNDETGAPLGSVPINIVGQPLLSSSQKATSANLAPIVAMTFNIGGDYGKHEATVTSGAGTVTYSASNVLTVSTSEPGYTDFDDGTAESANVTFGALPQAGLTSITQNFDTNV